MPSNLHIFATCKIFRKLNTYSIKFQPINSNKISYYLFSPRQTIHISVQIVQMLLQFHVTRLITMNYGLQRYIIKLNTIVIFIKNCIHVLIHMDL